MEPLSMPVARTIKDTAKALSFVSETTDDWESPILGHLVHPFVHPSFPGSSLKGPATYPRSMAAIGLEFAAGLLDAPGASLRSSRAFWMVVPTYGNDSTLYVSLRAHQVTGTFAARFSLPVGRTSCRW